MNTANPTPHANFPTRWVMILGVMVAIGPLAIDMYLPAIPSMADEFGVSSSVMTRSVSAYFIGLVLGQLFYGPFSDRVGRVLPMYIGMGIFISASLICATTNHEYVLFAARTLQALGACVTAVVTRAAIRDTLNPVQAARAFSLMVLVMGLAPILAPSLGHLILKVADWHAIFWFLAGYGVLNVILTKCFLKETLAPENRNTRPVSETLSGYVSLLKDRRFLHPAVAAGLLQGAFFIYLTISSELFMVQYGLNERQFAIAFGANAFGFIAMTQVNQFLTRRVNLVRLLRIGAAIQLIFASVLMGFGLIMGADTPLIITLICTLLCISGLGLTQPNATAVALAYQKKRAGMASAAQGALQFSVGIFGGLLLSFVPASPVTKLSVIVTLLVGMGTYLVYRIDKRIDLSAID